MTKLIVCKNKITGEMATATENEVSMDEAQYKVTNTEKEATTENSRNAGLLIITRIWC